MENLPICPKCSSSYVYQDRELLVCPECSHEWSENSEKNQVEGEETHGYKDAFGNTLVDGDSVTIIKDLKVKGAASALKVGTRVKNIRLVDGDHNIDCKIDGFGPMKIKSEFVKKI